MNVGTPIRLFLIARLVDFHIKCDGSTVLKEASDFIITCILVLSSKGETLIHTIPLVGYTGLFNVRTSLKRFPSFSPFDSSTAEIKRVNAA